MAFRPDNEGDIKLALNYVRDIAGSYFGSSIYSDFVTRYERRRDAYLMRNRGDNASWRSKLHSATFFLGCKALDAQFKAAHSQDPFIHVTPNDDSVYSQEAEEMSKLAHFDLQYDLKLGNFRQTLFDLYYYVELVGTAVGREYIRSEQKAVQRAGRNITQFGVDTGRVDQEQVQRKEFTKTMLIHPCNFAHDPTKRDFMDSEWSCVRFKLNLSELYRFRGHANYYQPGVEETIKKIEQNTSNKIESDRLYFYGENENSNDRNMQIVVVEWSGPLRYKGNMADLGQYYMLYVPAWDTVLRCGKSPFNRHPYWKMQCYPDPSGPYGVGPCDSVLPINIWENNVINRFNDYVNVVSKFMFLARQEHITGGFPMLYDTLPLGIIPVESTAPRLDDVLTNVPVNGTGLQVLSGAMELIEKYKQQQGMSSNLRGKDSEQLNDTATGISLIAQREDEMTKMMQAGCDSGIVNGMQIKLQHRQQFFSEPVRKPIAPERRKDFYDPITGKQLDYVEYYPYELQGHDWAFSVNRKLPDVEAGKHLNFVKLLGFLDNKLQQSGQSLPASIVIDSLERAGRALGIDGIDEVIRKVKEQVGNPPAVSGGMAQGQLPAPAPVGPGGQPPPPPAGPQGAPQPMGAMSAALA
jgi:hypothetical protein